MLFLKLAIFNCLSLAGRKRKQWLLNHLQERIDIAFLQETKLASNEQLDSAARFFRNRFHCHFSPACGRSAGSAIMIRKRPGLTVYTEYERDDSGRVCSVNLILRGEQYRLISILAPDNPPQRTEYFTKLKQYLDTPCRAVLAGDFNCILQARDCTKRRPADPSLKELQKLLRYFDLQDGADGTPAPAPAFTHWQGDCHVRLDRVYVSSELICMTASSRVTPVAFSDHSFVTITFENGDARSNKEIATPSWQLWKLTESL
ncbi:hypothetical protein HPB48_017214 [Haemaphysalis longicornis]|uniref:Endonuclease/exonuclease/phosphatase domain-containing protein n=1 Tax=Haemaphysalis longicornis TaxID=44386 RepID=A0A9J6FVZ0_HAELO|nr:hypothetical protein HPB48_017214 [Haemaphysalis longicornis]